MAEGIYSPSGINNVYARNSFGRKLLASFPVVSINVATDLSPEGDDFSVPVNSSGTTVVISAVEGKSIEITGYNLVASGASTLSIRSSGTDIFGPISLAAGGQINNAAVLISGNVQEPIVLVTTSQVGGFINYRLS